MIVYGSISKFCGLIGFKSHSWDLRTV